MSKLIRWETPFTDKQYPSVVLAVDIKLTGNSSSSLKAVVARDIYKYPKYLVDFGEVIAFTCMEEGFCPERDYDSATIEEINLSAYQLLDSSWVKSYELGNIGGRFEKFFHYLIFGGDNNIEVITPNMRISS